MRRLSLLAVVAVLAVIACQLTSAPTPTVAPSPTAVPPSDTPQPTATATPAPTATPRPRPTFTPSGPPCLDPAEVSLDDVGTTVVVCGRVVDEGEKPCPDCPYGAYSYLTLKGGFNIISYYWNFISYENACLIASDKVERMGAKPIFVYGANEGFAGSKREIAAAP